MLTITDDGLRLLCAHRFIGSFLSNTIIKSTAKVEKSGEMLVKIIKFNHVTK